MGCLDVVRVIVPSRCTHAARFSVIRDDVFVAGEFLVAEGADFVLLDNLSIEQAAHGRLGADFPVAARVMLVRNAVYSRLEALELLRRALDGQQTFFASAAVEAAVDGAAFVDFEFHSAAFPNFHSLHFFTRCSFAAAVLSLARQPVVMFGKRLS